MLYELISRNIRTDKLIRFILIPMAIAAIAIACGDNSKSKIPLYTQAQIDSALGDLVPDYKKSSPRYKQWREEQSEAIRRDNLDLQTVKNVIVWHRREISKLAKLPGYTTYLLVERARLTYPLPGALPFVVTELNTTPRQGFKGVFIPGAGEGMMLDTSSIDLYSQLLRRLEIPVTNVEQFWQVCVTFLELCYPNVQVILHNSHEWSICYMIDSLTIKAPDSLYANDLAGELYFKIQGLPSAGHIDTFELAQKFDSVLTAQFPQWELAILPSKVRKPEPTFSQNIYRVHVDVMDTYALSVIRNTFTYDPVSGLQKVQYWLKQYERASFRLNQGG